ncbi:hypothetical protein ON010_g14297 [Phytophthora cinnamomi]|nr:hypothetical protein ON010_g14297 [Phytophthora cinnamomi]
MDDEHINESLACDCCNNWFHIGCLPPIKSSGRWKDSTYVCPRCIDDARAFHNGNRSVLKAKAAYISTSNAIAKAAKKATSPKEGETVVVTVAKTKKPSKAVVVVDDDDEDMEEKKQDSDDEEMEEEREEEVKIAKAPAKRKRKLSEVIDSPANAPANENANDTTANSAANAPSEANPAKSAPAKSSSPTGSPSKVDLPALEAKTADAAKTSANVPTTKAKAIAEEKANESTTPANGAGSAKPAAMMHASPEHTIKAATEAHSSPSKAATAKIGASNKSETTVDKQVRTDVETSTDATGDSSNRHSSCNTVMSLLNSPPTNEGPAKAFKPTVASLPMLNSAKDKSASSSKPSMAMPANFQVYVKMEQKNGRFPLYPRPMPNIKSVQAGRKEVTTAPKSSKPTAGRKPKPGQGAGGRGGLSAFDILREVASQEIDEGAAPVKPKREKRGTASRTSSSSANKRAKIDASTSTANTSASPGRAATAGVPSHPVSADTNQSAQTRERIQMNSFVDLHFSIRKEMYLRFCRLEEEGMLTRDSAHLLRSLIYPTSERFQDLKFVYLVNKDLPSVQLTKRLLEAVPYPPTVAKPIATTVPHATSAAIRSPLGGKGIGGLPMTMGMFSAGLGRNSSPAGTPRIGLLPPPPGSTLLRPEPPRPDESSRLASGSGTAGAPQPDAMTDELVFALLNESLESQIAEIDTVFELSGIAHVNRDMNNGTKVHQDPNGVSVRHEDVRLLPFSSEAVHRTMWGILRYSTAKEMMLGPFKTEVVGDNRMNVTMIEKIQVGSAPATNSIRRFAFRRVFEKNRTVVVWSSYVEMDGSVFVRLREKGYCTTSPFSFGSTSSDSVGVPGSITRMAIFASPEMTGFASSEDQKAHIGEMTELVVGTYRVTMGLMHQMIDTLLLREAMGGKVVSPGGGTVVAT